MIERDWQAQVIDLARLLGWRVAHFRPAQTAKGWRTPVEADGAGFPDLVLVRPPRLIFAELKTDKGTLSDAQTQWLNALGVVADGIDSAITSLPDPEARVEVAVWRPTDLDAVCEALKR